ncbi:MAG: DUF6106 family protein [Clostridia bacterium]|nr:DUF6106 family protein [Clostridia bacterium]
MDIYIEHIVKHKKTIKDYAAVTGIIVGALVLSMACLLFRAYLFGLSFIVIALICYGAYMLITSLNIEYEYILTNGELDIDKIIAKRGRKRIITVNFKEVELCARVNDAKFQNEYKNTQSIGQTLFLAGDIKSEGIYFADFHQDGVKKRVLFEPNERIIEGIKKINPRNVYV